jgi:hypothetical protein
LTEIVVLMEDHFFNSDGYYKLDRNPNALADANANHT